MSYLLVIDDDRSIQRMVAHAFENSGTEVRAALTAEQGMEMIRASAPDAVLLDIQLPKTSGLEVFKEIRQIDRRLPVIFITSSDRSETAIEAMSLGAYDYVLKPLDLVKMVELVGKALETRRVMRVPVEMPGPDSAAGDADSMIGRSPAMQEIYKAIGRVAPQDVIVLVRGESGTGKELVARAIYHHSARASGPFLEINCAAIPDTLLESELFGHEKGAFTGADQRRVGKFERCSGGTIFLDEVGDMSPLIQSKVLRILQEQRFERVGGSTTLETDVRIIAATNRDLEKMVADGQFREDLYYRLNGFAINIPPLRERGDDLQLLIEHYLGRLSQRLGKDIHSVAPEAMAILMRYTWPGNIRELQGELNRAILKTVGPVILATSLSPTIRSQPSNGRAVTAEGDISGDLVPVVQSGLNGGSNDLYAETLEAMERYLLTQVLRKTGGNQSQAAATLGITRGCLRNKVRQLNISIGHTVSVRDTSTANNTEAASASEELPQRAS
ncbi:MAG: sigma-54 dependent transcriptional regulator [Planctomycetia bacterium]|nr:sigma-54 dependent transcriptional regulator [Planctomycetia bacterium]